jgi:hypothetical protein
MKLHSAALAVVLVLGLSPAVPVMGWAGGSGFGNDDDNLADEGPSYFGFVREINGAGVAEARVTAEFKDRGALITRTDILGVYKIPGFGKDTNPDDVTISCTKDGYKQASTMRRPRVEPDSNSPIEVECYLQRN